jgi:hypothetical protein
MLHAASSVEGSEKMHELLQRVGKCENVGTRRGGLGRIE